MRWRKEFLLSLQLRTKWNRPRRNLSIGDIVLVKEDTLPRNCWQLARVSKTYPSEDGYIRSVQVDLGDAAIPAERVVQYTQTDSNGMVLNPLVFHW